MQDFIFHNPVKIIFGKGTISKLDTLLPAKARIMMTFGGGSIKKNGVYNQVTQALAGCPVIEFEGIEPNPRYETCMKAVDLAREENIDFLLAVGGGSVLDATKFIAAAAHFQGKDPWDILTRGARDTVHSAIPLGSVLTLPATGSEMNINAVISRDSTREKLAFGSPHLYPIFSILDPETTYSLPKRQVVNGIVDAFVHVCEQYMTFNVNAPLQDRQAEGILLTLVEEAPAILQEPPHYEARANFMWCATNALNHLISSGVPQDWATHMIGHEITALHGLDHAQTLAIVMPALWRHQAHRKADKLVQFAQRIWNVNGSDRNAVIDAAISKTKDFFHSIGMATRLRDYNLTPADCQTAADVLHKRGDQLGEHGAIGRKEILEILELAA